MTTQDFLNQLSNQDQTRPLEFVLTNNQTVPTAYHVTEIKTAVIHSMDCGGKANHWHETILQLWVPANDASDTTTAMSIQKFLGIYERVSASVPIQPDAIMRVEYGAEQQAAISYVITGVQQHKNSTQVILELPAVACKAHDRQVGVVPVLGQATGCCDTSEAAVVDNELAMVNGCC